jgi:apolipoprotein N-acyltransferase
VLATQDTTPGRQHMMMADLPTRGTRTLYNVIGDVFAWLCVAAVVCLGALAIRGRATPAR